MTNDEQSPSIEVTVATETSVVATTAAITETTPAEPIPFVDDSNVEDFPDIPYEGDDAEQRGSHPGRLRRPSKTVIFSNYFVFFNRPRQVMMPHQMIRTLSQLPLS